MGRRWALWLDLAVKAALVGLLLFAVARPDLPQFHGKAMVARALLYPISALIVPVVWWLRGRPRPYPYALDILLVLPFLIDVAGNAANLYDTIGWWDDLNHFVNWAFLVAAFGQLLLGDLALGLAGSTLAAALTVTILWPTRVRPAASRAGAR